MKILCKNYDEYLQAIKTYTINSKVEIYAPEDCLLSMIWGVDDVRNAKDDQSIRPEDAKKLLEKVANAIILNGIELLFIAGWEDKPYV